MKFKNLWKVSDHVREICVQNIPQFNKRTTARSRLGNTRTSTDLCPTTICPPDHTTACLQLTGAGAAGLDGDGTRLGDREGGVHVHLLGAPLNERIAQARRARRSHHAAARGRWCHGSIRCRVPARALQIVFQCARAVVHLSLRRGQNHEQNDDHPRCGGELGRRGTGHGGRWAPAN